jgi:peptide/nickel transport system substrate-binding protein
MGIRRTVAVAALGFFLAAFQSTMALGQADRPKPGGMLRFALAKDIGNLNPFVNTRSINHDLRTLMYETLLTVDKNFETRPSLAEFWDISKDGRDYTFRLRSRVRYHNAQGMTAEDVKWSVEYARESKNAAYGLPFLSPVESVTVLDARRIRIRLKEPMSPFLASLTSISAFPVIPKQSLQIAENPRAFPPGTGPYQFVEWVPGQRLVVKRFPDYWQKGIPRIDEIHFRPIEDETVRLTALRAADVDLIERFPDHYVERVTSGQIKSISLTYAMGAGLRGYVFNTQTPPFSNVKLRQAIAYAMDKQEILKGAYSGIGTVINQKGIPGSAWYFNIPERKRDLEKAKALLREAGFPEGIKVQLLGRSGNQAEAQIFQAELKEAGIDVELQFLEPVTYLKKIRMGDFTVATIGGIVYLDPDQNYYPDYHTEKIEKGKTDRRNLAGYSNARVDRLLEEARVELDTMKRQKLYKEVVETLHDEVPQIHMLASPYVFGFQSYVKGLEFEPQGRFFVDHVGLPMAWIDK